MIDTLKELARRYPRFGYPGYLIFFQGRGGGSSGAMALWSGVPTDFSFCACMAWTMSSIFNRRMSVGPAVRRLRLFS